MERVKRWVLRVDGVGNNGVNTEGTVRIDFHDLLKVLFSDVSCESTRRQCSNLTSSLSAILGTHGMPGLMAAQCTPPAKDPLGTFFNAS